MIELLSLLGIVLILLILMTQHNWRLPNSKTPLVLDTSVLIDGRIVGIVDSGFINDLVVIPYFVVNELQLLADSSNSFKRLRARGGLDVVKVLQDSPLIEVKIDKTEIPEKDEVDEKLVWLCKKNHGRLMTNDFNLVKVAEIEHVKVLNIQTLSQLLKPLFLPGERATIKIVSKGNNPKQGIGYLDDGTMVVVDNAASKIHSSVEVEFERSHQTISGRMLFAAIVGAPPAEKKPTHSKKPATKR